MPNETFNRLPEAKKSKIEMILLNIFYNRHVSNVKVSEIVEQMEMSRGAFYKYFLDLEDAYTYIVKKSSMKIHQSILNSIKSNNENFFDGLESFIVECTKLDNETTNWKMIHLLTEEKDIQTYKRLPFSKDSAMIKDWILVLKNNKFNINSTEEAVSFLYFIMLLVMDTLTEMVVNDWDSNRVSKEFKYKINWLQNGIK